jgi:hypothetical protein
MKIRSILLAACVLLGWTSSLRGQSVVINEVQVKPPVDALSATYQSMFNCSNPTFGAEWVELYNPDPCLSMDVSGYILGARTIATNFGAVMLPAGTTIPPLGFLVLGGPNAPSVDINLTSLCATSNMCIDGDGRWYMENGDGWVALYRPTGTVADAVYWTFSSGETIKLTTDPDFASGPCTPAGSGAGALASASTMGAAIHYAGAGPSLNQTVYRTVDGGATWANNGTPTPKACNAACSSLICILDGETLSLGGAALKSANYLYWFSPADASHFQLERSSGEGHFERVMEAEAGQASGSHYYWMDEEAGAGTWYYRLTSLDANGEQMQQSEVVKLSQSAAADVSVCIGPNPAAGEAWLTVASSETTDARWALYDCAGRILHEEFYHELKAPEQRHLDLSWVADGLCFWRFTTASGTVTGKLMME